MYKGYKSSVFKAIDKVFGMRVLNALHFGVSSLFQRDSSQSCLELKSACRGCLKNGTNYIPTRA